MVAPGYSETLKTRQEDGPRAVQAKNSARIDGTFGAKRNIPSISGVAPRLPLARQSTRAIGDSCDPRGEVVEQPEFCRYYRAQRLLIAHWHEVRASDSRVAREALIRAPSCPRWPACLSSSSTRWARAVSHRGSRLRDFRHGRARAGRRSISPRRMLRPRPHRGARTRRARQRHYGTERRLHAFLRLPLCDEHGDLTGPLPRRFIAHQRDLIPAPPATRRKLPCHPGESRTAPPKSTPPKPCEASPVLALDTCLQVYGVP